MLFFVAISKFKLNLIAKDKSKSTVAGYNTELSKFLMFLEKQYNRPLYLQEVGLMDMENYLEFLISKNQAPATRKRIINIFRSFFKFCLRSGLLNENPALFLESVKPQPKEREFINDVEFMQLLNVVENTLYRTVISTLYYTGLRISECLSLKYAYIDKNLEYLIVKNGKGRKQRIIPINQSLKLLLENYFKEFPKSMNEYVFATKKTGSLSAGHVNMILRESRKLLAWKKQISCHNLRHSFASNLVKNNVNPVHIQKLLGHSSLAVTSVYTHSNLEDLKKAVDCL